MPFKTPGKNSCYIRNLLPPETDEKAAKVLSFADANFIPVLLPETAAFLRQVVTLKKPSKILEIGTAIGYSAHVMLSSCDAELFTIDYNDELLDKASNFFRESGYEKRVNIFRGDASEIIPIMSGEFDFVFLDGPKTKYLDYYPYIKNMMTVGGVLFCDNVLFNGMVTGEAEFVQKKASIVQKLDEFLHKLCSDRQFLTSVLPVGDGVSLSIKKG